MSERRIAHYRLDSLLGAGGMGEVHAAHDDRLERRVAIKVLPASRAGDGGARIRMVREARAASALQHPNIVTVHEVGEHDGDVYIVMELVEGETFAARIDRRGALPVEEALGLVDQVADALGAAHEAGILHRDIKSANLMVDRRGRVRVLDFGLSKRVGAPTARGGALDAAEEAAPIDPAAPTQLGSGSSEDGVTVHGAWMGTPGYAALELLDGDEADVRSDVYSLAVVAYELFTGKLPYAGDTLLELKHAMRGGAPVPPSVASGGVVDAGFDPVLARALAPARDDRFPTVAALRAALHAAVPAPRAPSGRRTVAIAGLAALGAAGAGALWLATRDRTGAASPPPPDAAPRPGVADRAAVRPLTEPDRARCDYAPSFVDAATVLFDRTDASGVDLYRVSSQGGPVEQLTFATGWEWRSHPGRARDEAIYLAHHTADGRDGVVALDLARGTSQLLIERVAADAVAVGDAIFHVTRDGRELRRWRDRRDEVFLVVPNDLEARLLAASPRGDRLALAAMREGRMRLCAIAIADHTITCGPEPIDSGPAFSPDGESVYVARGTTIQRVDLASGKATTVLEGRHADGGIAIAPDGSALVYSACGQRSPIVDLSVTPPAVIVDDGSANQPTAGPDGVLVWQRVKGGARVLVLRDAAGQERELTTSALGDVERPAISVDGRKVAFAARTGDRAGIYWVRARGGEPPTRLTESGEHHDPVWTRSGDQVLFTAIEQGTPRIYAISSDGGVAAPLGPPNRFAAALDPVSGLVLTIGTEGAYWMDPATGAERPGPEPPEDPAYVAISPGGTWLLIQAGSAAEQIWRRSLQPPGPLEPLGAVMSGQTIDRGAIRDDGHVLLAPSTWSGNLDRVPAAPGTRF